MTRLIPLTLLLTALPWLSGCPDCTDDIAYLAVDFEGCSGTCAFDVSGEGDAYLTPTIHPGEHGLLIDGATRASLAIAATVDVNPDSGREVLVEFVTNCARDAFIDVAVRNPNDYVLTIQLGAGYGQVWPGDFEVVSVPMPRHADPDGYYELEELRLIGVAGSCVIDQISISVPGDC